MKKLIAILLAACLIVGGAVGYISYRNARAETPAAPAPTEAPLDAAVEPQPEQAETPEEPAIRQIDLDALYATHDPDEVVATVDGQEITWELYYYMLQYEAKSTQSYLEMLSYYGITEDWADPVEEGGPSNAEDTVSNAEATLVQMLAIEGFEAANGVTLTEEDQAALAEQKQNDILALGAEATEADFVEYLASFGMTEAIYDRFNAINRLYQQGFTRIYGEDGEKLSDQEALAFLEDNGYMAANHILLMTLDPATYESLDEAAIAEKKAQAETIAAELQAIGDREKLLARFAELKAEYDEDSGKEAYPDGYTFTPGTMVTEFEDAVLALAEYGVSDPVESVYGYHVIMRLPLNVDEVIAYSSAGTPMTARSVAANTAYGEGLQAYLDKLEIQYAKGFTVPDLLEYVK